MENKFVFFHEEKKTTVKKRDIFEISLVGGITFFCLKRNGISLNNHQRSDTVSLPIHFDELSILSVCQLFAGGKGYQVKRREDLENQSFHDRRRYLVYEVF